MLSCDWNKDLISGCNALYPQADVVLRTVTWTSIKDNRDQNQGIKLQDKGCFCLGFVQHTPAGSRLQPAFPKGHSTDNHTDTQQQKLVKDRCLLSSLAGPHGRPRLLLEEEGCEKKREEGILQAYA